MKRRKILLLIILLGLLGLAAWLQLTKQRKETLRYVFTADSTLVSRIELSDPQGSITFTKSDDSWDITSPIKWRVEKDHFRQFFHEVILQQYGTKPLSEGKEALSQYSLDESRVLRVKVFNRKGKLHREVWFSGLNNSTDYFRFAGDDRVYRIKQKGTSLYRPDIDKWRSPFVLSLAPEQLLSISVQHTKNSYLLTSRDSLWHYQDKNEDFDIPAGNVALGKIFNNLTRLGSYTVLSGDKIPSADSLGASLCEVNVLASGKRTYRLNFHQYQDKYLLTVDSHPDMYFVVLFDTLFRFTRHAAMFRAREGYPGL